MSKGSQEAEQIQQKNGNMVEKACSIVKYWHTILLMEQDKLSNVVISGRDEVQNGKAGKKT
jgi:hypothetical protein